ncbi:ParB family protein [Dickeya fangzhongdai]|uniref:ParB family protein n=1 Tax=Dickeya fangzhongdai TaxID=1778540 RepID=UPI001EFAA9F2|nr:ParB family protein [Dickeya fangzhongdai]ULR31646.1 ParB family protein [Dickeya fangzhongdai]
MKGKIASLQLGSAMLQGSREPSQQVASLPISEMPMVLTLDQMAPHPDNPRKSRNPKYEEIKESIRHRGLDTVLKVTRDPNVPDIFVFSDGGNTRYEILSELWAETRDERFFRHTVIFKPWPGRLQCVIGHLAENEVRGELTFIEKAFGVQTARALYEEQLGKSVSLRELATLLTEEGLPIDHSSISRMESTLTYLYPHMPDLLESGMGAPQIRSLLSLRHDAEKVWSEYALNASPAIPFETVFGDCCKKFDSPDHWSLDMFRDEFIGDLIRALPHPSLNYDRWVMELDPKVRNQRKLFGETEPLPTFLSDTGSNESQDEGNQSPEPQAIKPPTPMSNGGENQSRPQPNPTRQTAPDVNPTSGINHEQGPAFTPMSSALNEIRVTAGEGGGVPEHLDDDGEYETNDLNMAPGTPFLHSGSTPLTNDGEYVAPLSEPHSPAQPSGSVSFANSGLEPVTDIWQISSLQDDIEHLQDCAYRLAFELAEAMEHANEVYEAKGPMDAGYITSSVSDTAFILFLGGLAGQHGETPFNMFSFCLNFIGSTMKADLPVLPDIYVVKTMRLIRVLRRLRELQRQVVSEQTEQ